MRQPFGDAPVELLNANVATSSVADRLLVTVWRGGQQLTDNLEVSGYTLSWDTNRRVQGQGNLLIADPDGSIWPRNIASAIAPGGSRVRIAYQYGATQLTVPLGVWRIRKVTPHIHLLPRRITNQTQLIPSGGTVAIEIDEELASLELDRLDIGERHSQAPTILDEVQRLANPYMLVHRDPTVTNAPLPRIEYESEMRLEVIQQLLDRINATYRMRGNGQLEIVPATGTPTAWPVEPYDGGTMITISMSMSDDGLVNAVTSHVTLEDETTLVGRARLAEGPLAWGGPFGRVPAFRGANLATTQQEVDADAQTALARLSTAGDIPITLETLANPGLQLHDRVPLLIPDFPTPHTVTARVTAMTLAGSDGVTAKSMPLQLAVAHNDLPVFGGF